MPTKIEFSSTDLDLMKDLYGQGQSIRALGRLFKVDHKVIAHRLSEMNIRIQSYSTISKRRLKGHNPEIIYQYENGSTIAQIAKSFSTKRQNIKEILEQADIRLRTCKGAQHYHVNEQFFDLFENEETCYWLGYIYADGHVTPNQLTFRIAKKDTEHLERFKIVIESNHPIIPQPVNAVNLKIARVRFVQPLIDLGLQSKKSDSLPMPKLRDDLMHHFIRGFMDGDGGFYYYPNPVVSFHFALYSDTEQFLLELQNLLIRNCGLNHNKLCGRGTTRPKSRILRYGGRLQVKRIFDYLYQDATIWLPRKREKIEPYL